MIECQECGLRFEVIWNYDALGPWEAVSVQGVGQEIQ